MTKKGNLYIQTLNDGDGGHEVLWIIKGNIKRELRQYRFTKTEIIVTP
jgi:hypothetical protein